jgi:DNA-binding LytR/AlgR family response regulator
MEIVVCEDRKDHRDALCFLIERFFKEQNCPVIIKQYENSGFFLKDWETKKTVKIAFLDIYMPGLNGIDTARKIRETDKDMVIVFTTTSAAHALDGYSVNALQYLIKPVKYPEVAEVLDKCVKIFADSFEYVEVIADRLTTKALQKNILYVEILKDTLLIHTLTETIKSRFPLYKFEEQLNSSSFLRTSQSFIVNMRYIEEVGNNYFIMINGAKIPIRRSDKLAIKQAHRDYLFAMTRGDV